jgi:hypothetical protein
LGGEDQGKDEESDEVLGEIEGEHLPGEGSLGRTAEWASFAGGASLVGTRAFLDTGASISIFPTGTPVLAQRRRHTNITLADGSNRDYSNWGLHEIYGWGLMGDTSVIIVSFTKLRERFKITTDDALNVFVCEERDGIRVLNAWEVGGVYVIDPAGKRQNELSDAARSIEAGEYCAFAHRTGMLRESTARARAILLHEALGHINFKRLAVMIRNNRFKVWDLKEKDILDAGLQFCHACRSANDSWIQHKQVHTKELREIGRDFHCDLAYVGKHRYLFAVESVTRFMIVYKLNSRKSKDFLPGFVSIKAYFVQRGWTKSSIFWWDGEKGAIASIGTGAIPNVEIRVTTAKPEKIAEAMTKVVHNSMRATWLGHPYLLEYALLFMLFEWCIQSINLWSNQADGNGPSRWELVNRTPPAEDGDNLGLGFGVVVYVKEVEQRKSLLVQRNCLGIIVGRSQDTFAVTVMLLDDERTHISLRRDEVRMADLSLELIALLKERAEQGPIVSYRDMCGVVKENLPLSPFLGQAADGGDPINEEEDASEEGVEEQETTTGEGGEHSTGTGEETRYPARDRRRPDYFGFFSPAGLELGSDKESPEGGVLNPDGEASNPQLEVLYWSDEEFASNKETWEVLFTHEKVIKTTGMRL